MHEWAPAGVRFCMITGEGLHDGRMSTIVFFHAHPDDEASATSGSIMRAVEEGHRVVVVFATDGDHGDVPDDLAEGETLVDRRHREAEASARVTGAHRVVWLGYRDSGMTGWQQNDDAGCFHAADLLEAATRLSAVLDEEDADVLVGYDWHGGYGHPDHIKVHHVAHRAVELARRRPKLWESTPNRDNMRALFEAAKAAGMEEDWDPDAPADDGNPFGTVESEIDVQVDVSAYLDRKRQALACHISQVSDIGMMLSMPPEVFAMMFGQEHYIDPDHKPADDSDAPRMRAGWIL